MNRSLSTGGIRRRAYAFKQKRLRPKSAAPDTTLRGEMLSALLVSSIPRNPTYVNLARALFEK